MPKQLNKATLIPNDYFCAERRKRQDDFYLHGHEFYEVEYVVSGQGENIINGQAYALTAGSLYFLRPGDLHEIKVQQPMVLFNLSFMPQAIDDKLFAKLIGLGSVSGVISPNERGYFEQTFAALCRENEREERCKKQYCNGLLTVLLCHVLRLKGQTVAQTPTAAIMRAVGYVNDNATQNPTLAQVSAVACLQVNYFCKAFKKATGKTYVDYLNGIKIEQAARLLTLTDAPITEICFASGFLSVAQFSREFKRRIGLSPTAYKKEKNQSI